MKLKEAFKRAVEEGLGKEELLRVKEKSAREMVDENEAYKEFLEREKENKDLLERFWGREEELDEKERFLRKYILTQGWVD